MKKNKTPRIVHFFERIINIRYWFDWERMKAFTLYLFYGIKKFFVPQRVDATENFEEAKVRLNLSDKDLLIRQKGLFRLSILMACIAVLLFVYAIYLLFSGSPHGFALTIVVMSIALILAFRYHFWYFQIKERKLGCTIHQWFRQGIMGDKP